MTKLPFPSRMNSGRLRGEWVASFRGKYSASKLKSSTGTFVFRNDVIKNQRILFKKLTHEDKLFDDISSFNFLK